MDAATNFQSPLTLSNMPTIVTDKPFDSISTYPDISKDYAYTFHAMKNLHFDTWLASHASQFSLLKKHRPGDIYNPAAFIDREGYDAELAGLKKNMMKSCNNRFASLNSYFINEPAKKYPDEYSLNML